MPKYVITLEETVHYDIEVEADDADAAGEEAAAIWADSEDPTKDFGGTGCGVEVINAEEMEGDDDED